MHVVHSESYEPPVEIDTDSSPEITYVRSAIEEKQRQEEEDGSTMTFYTYLEEQYTKEEYEARA